MKSVKGNILGQAMRTLIVAELSANHNQDIDIAEKTIRAAKECGADAVKIQTYTPDTMTIDCPKDYFKINHGTIWDGRNLYALYKEAYTPWEWHDRLKDCAQALGLLFFSTPFDFTAVDFLESKDVPIYKIASAEITDIPLIEYVASKGKPIMISTGIAMMEEIQDAVDICRKTGNSDITLLKCTSSYPAPIEEANLRTMVDMREKFGVKVGISDHTLGSDVAIAGVALGALVIEKHLILDRKIGGPDASFSMQPAEFASMVQSIRNVELALGEISYDLSAKVFKNRDFLRSLFVVENVKKGDLFTKNNIRSIRPGYGLAPKYYKETLGKRASCDIERGEPLSKEMIG
jgi:pseudaminic acid synthase